MLHFTMAVPVDALEGLAIAANQPGMLLLQDWLLRRQQHNN
jgi:hypothetical protein